jgi:hypothetical protein
VLSLKRVPGAKKDQHYKALCKKELSLINNFRRCFGWGWFDYCGI